LRLGGATERPAAATPAIQSGYIQNVLHEARRLTILGDDGIVVVVERRFTVEEYLGLPETNRPQELAYGILREPPSPFGPHQLVVGRLYSRLDMHVRWRHLGQVVLSPIDVVLDREQALVVQPDLVFISAERRDILTDRIWGPPDLAVEVLSTTRRQHDRVVKVTWYREYGVRECWVVDPDAREIEVFDLTTESPSRIFSGRQAVRSQLFPHLRVRPVDVFDDQGVGTKR
jgi:Uma2 family endonuclease